MSTELRQAFGEIGALLAGDGTCAGTTSRTDRTDPPFDLVSWRIE